MSTPAIEADEVTLEWFVNARTAPDAQLAAFASDCTAEAEALVARHVRDADVPEVIRSRAVLEVGADLFYRRAARNGVVQFGSGVEAASVVRINRDPMTQAYPLLAPYLPMAFA
ncbi:hypothetical protein GCM10010922_01390 [Microbacterium sorbitolivorans]|uniref:Phage gp6-like head-tail connector protein n=1 Tax=Microbacterium sorbitolivorans TaxID=1867410 RepID=A0A367Y734_9MICO|nr:hypothetical protein [Microbacterium sorbitolivorans]RCK61674.1 hypothetical protein DTO57_03340 [Microbacterium sorbitolivorans]GGF30169.1 hypothetical protein GCM10010922_01390 [Microbacterium sorbitolivorans]